MFWTDFNKRLEKHIKDLGKYGFLPDDWRWHQDKIRELDHIDKELINDLVGIHKRHKLSPDLFSNLEPLVFELHNDLEGILHGTLTEKTDKEREQVNRLLTQIRELFSEDKIKILNYIKSKIIDISKFGTYFHLCDIKDLPSIWKIGLRGGSAIMLGPLYHPIETRHRGVIKVVDLNELIHCDEDLFGNANFGAFHSPPEKELNVSFPKLHEPVIKKNLEQAYEGYKNKMDFFEEVQSTRKSKKFLAYLILLRRKYKHLSEDQVISDPRDALFIDEAYERLNWFCNEALSFYREHPEYQSEEYWGHQTPIRWGIGIVINPKFIGGHKGVMPNEYIISNGNPREQILGIYLRDYSKLEMVMYIMFKQTKNAPEERVPIYYSDGSVAWPR